MSEATEIAPQHENTADGTGAQWRGHRVAPVVLQGLIFLGPLSVATCVGVLVSRSIPITSVALVVLRVVMTAAVSVATFVVVERLARRFLPLAALLRLNLVFPDRAPSRFSVALRSTSVRKLQQWVSEARASDNVAALAEKVVTLASALNTHDRRTRGHCERTRALADLIVEELHLSPAEANDVRWGAFLHDIGKLVVPAEILNKPGKPSAREWEVLKSHPEAGARLVAPLRPFLHAGVDAVASHHENFDGTGYPAGLRGEELPLAARIVSVADAFEVMTAVRAYKRPMSLQDARAELTRRSGTQFDPAVVRAFLNVSLGRVRWTLGLAAWLAELPLLSVVPRVAAQASTTVGGGAVVSPVSLPGVAAASFGAMAVIGHGHAPPDHHRPSAMRATPGAASSAPVGRSSTAVTTTGDSPPRQATTGTDVAATASPLGVTTTTGLSTTAVGVPDTVAHPGVVAPAVHAPAVVAALHSASETVAGLDGAVQTTVTGTGVLVRPAVSVTTDTGRAVAADLDTPGDVTDVPTS